MKELFTNKYFILLLVVTLILLTAAALYTSNREEMTFGEDLVGSVITPFQALFSSAVGATEWFFGYFSNVDNLRVDNAALTQQVNSLNDALRQVEHYKIENERLKALLMLKEDMTEYGIVAAEVIARDPGSWYSSFTINKGRSDGLQARQAVITSNGLVGHIHEIGAGWAKVISIIDTQSSVGAMVARTGDIAVIESDIELIRNGLCKMTHIGKNANIMTGDMVETSGLGGIYPKGILIGRIKEMSPETSGISQYAIIEPAADFEHISTVAVLTAYPNE
ncbi:MAG: rod shape-determining protein MreC [Firmicutes bacterium]|nr:rod shape-determining protein MreC [Bacillota bacterium]